MSAPLISIILPTYNGSKYIRKSIESCLSQTFHDFELIVVNDCSNDNTKQIVEEYCAKDSRVILLNNEFNKKLPLSLNTGFDKAKGKYFTWTSDDNFYAPTALEKLLAILEGNPEIDLVYSDYQVIDENDNTISQKKLGDVNASFIDWIGAGACFLYKREIHSANNGYNPGAFLIEDFDFFVRAFMKFNFYYLQTQDLYYYREHDGSLTATQYHTINTISKIFLERNLPGLQNKLSPKQMDLLYRKFAVYYAVSINNAEKYKEYLLKLRQHSLKQVVITVIYVLLKKIKHTIVISLAGIIYFFKIAFKK